MVSVPSRVLGSFLLLGKKVYDAGMPAEFPAPLEAWGVSFLLEEFIGI